MQVLALLLFGLVLGVYISGMPPSITWSNAASDSGELATAVKTLGVPHPPGYPTYVLLGRLFAFLPVGDTAFRLSIMSAVSGAAAVVATFFAARALLAVVAGHRKEGTPGEPPFGDLAALVGALSLAFAPIFWSQAIVAEVYALSALFVAVIALLLLSWLRDLQGPTAPSWRRPVLACFLLGVGMGSHFTVAGIALPVLALVAWRIHTRRVFTWGLMGGALALGLAVFIYLPISASGAPPVNWGDPRSWSGFWWQVSGAPYREYVFGVAPRFFDDRLGAWAEQMLEQFNGLGVVLGLVGVWRLARRDLWLAGAMALAFLFLAAYATFYRTADSFVFLVPSLFVAALWITVGSQGLLASLLPRLGGYLHRGRSALGPLAATLLLLLIPGLSALRSYPSSGDLRLDLSGDSAASDYDREVFAAIESDAMVLADTDLPVFALWYRRYVLEPDSEVLVVARNLLQFRWYVESLGRRYPDLLPRTPAGDFETALLTLVEENLGRRPIYSTFQDPVLELSFRLRQEGRLYRVVGTLE